MKKNINKKELKKLHPKESFFLLNTLQKEKLFSFYKNYFQEESNHFLSQWIFEKIKEKIKFFQFLHTFYQFYTKLKEKNKKKLKKKKFYFLKTRFKNSESFFDIYKKNPFLFSKEKKSLKKTFQIEKRKKNSLFHQEDFFFKTVEPLPSSSKRNGVGELSPNGQPFLFHGFSYKIQTEKSLSLYEGTPFRFHWIRGNRMGGTSQYLLDLILFFLKKRIPYRRLCSILFQEVRRLSYIEGIRITYAGRLGGKTNKAIRTKKETKKVGKPSLHIFSAKIDFVQGEVQTKFGMIGIKLWIRYK